MALVALLPVVLADLSAECRRVATVVAQAWLVRLVSTLLPFRTEPVVLLVQRSTALAL